MLRYLRSVQGGAREAASTTERLVQVEIPCCNTVTHSPATQSSLWHNFVFPSVAFTHPMHRPTQMIPELHECMEINYNKRIIGLEVEATTIP